MKRIYNPDKLHRLKRVNMNPRWLSELSELEIGSIFNWLEGKPIKMRTTLKIEDTLAKFEREILEKRRKVNK